MTQNLSSGASGRRFLLVEDEAMISMLIEDMLDDLGHNIAAVATRFEDAITAATNDTFDAAILDLSLHGVLTYPVADVLKQRNIPFIFATGYGSEGIKDGYAGLPTLQKPFNADDLGQAIELVLEEKA